MHQIERFVKFVIFCLLCCLIVAQLLVLHTDINTYVNPVYEYIGVFDQKR